MTPQFVAEVLDADVIVAKRDWSLLRAVKVQVPPSTSIPGMMPEANTADPSAPDVVTMTSTCRLA